MTVFVVLDAQRGLISRWRSAGSKVWKTHMGTFPNPPCTYDQNVCDTMRASPPIHLAINPNRKSEDKDIA